MFVPISTIDYRFSICRKKIQVFKLLQAGKGLFIHSFIYYDEGTRMHTGTGTDLLSSEPSV